MSSINQISMMGTRSASSGPGALLSSENRENSSREVRSSAERTAAVSPSDMSPTATDVVSTNDPRGAGVDPDKLNEAIEAIREKLEPSPRALNFSVNEALNDVVVKVVDPISQQVIREIPPEEIIAMRERLREFDELRWSDVLPSGSLLSDVS